MEDQEENMPSTYQESMDELQEIIRAIEDEEISVDELEKKVKRGSQLIKYCKQKLTNTEQSINNILEELDQYKSEEGKE